MMDLVVWGHEHESIPHIYQDLESGLNYYQPGSTVATSLIEAEGIIKHCGLLTVNNQGYELTPHNLTKSHRAIIWRKLEFHHLALNDSACTDKDYDAKGKVISDDYAVKLLMRQFNECLEEFNSYLYKNEKKPLVRMKVMDQKFGIQFMNIIENKFVRHVSNPLQVIKFGNQYKMVKKSIDLINNFEQKLKDKQSLNYNEKTSFEELIAQFFINIKFHKIIFNLILPSMLFDNNHYLNKVSDFFKKVEYI